jgi:hypothetical protein
MVNGLLTIDAPNSTLSAVLKGVHDATGAEVEGASPSERVAVRLGPGDPRQVIAALLQGTPYDYLILGSLVQPDAVTRIVLTQPTDGSPAQSGPVAGHRPQPMPQPQMNESPDSPDDGATQPAGDIQADQTQPPPQSQPDQNPPKTPEQLFKELMPSQPPQPAEQPK